MIYTLVNPSDAISFETDNEAALMAGVLIATGSGMIMLERVIEGDDDDQRLPILGFMSEKQLAEWMQKFFGCPLPEYVDGHKAEIAAALSSYLYGSPDDRQLFDDAVRDESDPVAFRAKWNDDRRTSLSDYGKSFTRTIEYLTKTGTTFKNDCPNCGDPVEVSPNVSVQVGGRIALPWSHCGQRYVTEYVRTEDGWDKVRQYPVPEDRPTPETCHWRDCHNPVGSDGRYCEHHKEMMDADGSN